MVDWECVRDQIMDYKAPCVLRREPMTNDAHCWLCGKEHPFSTLSCMRRVPKEWAVLYLQQRELARSARNA